MTNKPGPKPKAGKPCQIRIRDLPDSPWLAGVWITKDSARVTAYDAIWRGAIVHTTSAEIREAQ
jgi:hypothetical protein